MLEAYEIAPADGSAAPALEAVLTFEERQKSRHKTTTRCGQPLGWFIERGTVLADGDRLRCSDGTLVLVTAAPETVSQVQSTDPLALTRAAYHLGNRHVPLQIGVGFLRYQHDHVLDDMVRGLGLTVECLQQPFNPENGAYHGHKHGHSHAHDHSPNHAQNLGHPPHHPS